LLCVVVFFFVVVAVVLAVNDSLIPRVELIGYFDGMTDGID
jgi:hypothetical protein